MEYPATLNIVRSLSPITELTTPASIRSIALPPVEKAYEYSDYKDESPIQPFNSGPPAYRGDEDAANGNDDNDDAASTVSHGSTQTVVPSSAEPSPHEPVSPHTPLPSPPSSIRPFPSPIASLPPPPRPRSTRTQGESLPSTPRSSAVPLDRPIIHEEPASLLGRDTDQTEQYEGHGEDHDEEDRMSVSTAGIAGIGTGVFAETVKQKQGRPKSLHGTRGPPRSPISPPLALPSHHASLVDIPNIPSDPPTPTFITTLNQPASGVRSPPASPQRSRPLSSRARPTTLKKRPNSLHTSRPTSWHSQRSIKAPKKGPKKGKTKGREVDADASGSSNEDYSDTIKSPPLPIRNVSPHKRIPSILLSLFDTGSARQSRTASIVSSPSGSDIPHSPASPPTPNLNTLDDPEWSAIQPPPQEAIRTSGTFGIRDDGSVHLLRNDDDHPLPRISTSSEPSYAGRQRRDSDNGTVKSGVLDRRILYVNNRDSIDETDENDARRRSLTPFELENPLSPLESVLSDRTIEEVNGPERKSVECQRSLLLNPGRSDASQRAQSPSLEQSSLSTRHGDALKISRAASRELFMVDQSTQTSVPASPMPSPRRPLPQPPLPSHRDHLPNGNIPSSKLDAPRQRHPESEKVRPSSLPPPPLTSAYPQPRPNDIPTGQTPELPLLIASHLLSSHAAALMRQSAGMIEGAEMMKRMADESMQWGSMLLNMASTTADRQDPPTSTFPTVPMPHVAPSRPKDRHGDGFTNMNGLQPTSTGLPYDHLYPSRPVYNPPPPPRSWQSPFDRKCNESNRRGLNEDEREVDTTGSPFEEDRYTRLPARTRLSRLSSRSSGGMQAGNRESAVESERLRSSLGYLQPDSAARISSEMYREVDDIGRRGFEELHKAEEVWVKGMRDIRSVLDAGPDTANTASESHTTPGSEEKHTAGSEEILRRKSRVSMTSGKRNSLLRPVSAASAVRTDESFLPQSADLSGTSTAGTKTDESFLPQSADLVTPIDDATVRPTRPRIQTRLPISPPPGPIDSAKGYDPSQIHTLLGDHFKPFDMPPLPYGGKSPTNGPPSALSNASSGARKLRKRARATSEKLRQSSIGGSGSVGGTVKSKKRHWWSRRSRVTGSDDVQEPPVTAF